MALEVNKRNLHKAASCVALVALVMSGGLAYMVSLQPELASRMTKAMVSQNFKLVTHKNGLASIEAADTTDTGLGSVIEAGDRFNGQMGLLGSSGN